MKAIKILNKIRKGEVDLSQVQPDAFLKEFKLIDPGITSDKM
jgi:hypothetical protein